jgi:phosphatidylglycerophosphate synthase
MDEKISATLKSSETEDWLDYHVVRPFSYHWAAFFNRFDIHPNTVTIWSMIIGALSCVFFAHGCFYYEGTMGLVYNLIAIVLLCIADILDCTDGQLARMSGKKSRLGRILDGVAGFTWFTPIYLALVWRFYHHHDIEFSLLGISDTEQNVMIATIVVFIIGLISGIHGLAGQQRLADYYIQAHLYFLKGEKGSELDNSAQQQEIYDKMDSSTSWVERLFQKSYIGYTQKQEGRTPQFQRLLRLLKTKFGTAEHIPATVREEFHQNSLPLMPWNGLLTFNFRSAWLFLFCLIDIPVGNFLFEIICMGLLTCYVNHRHETFCRKIADKVEKDAA